MSGRVKQFMLLAFATLFSPILAAIFTADVLAVIMAPDLVFRVDLNSVDSRPATLREIATSLVGFGFIGAAAGVMVGWPAMLIAGLPTHLWLIRKGRTALRAYGLAGLVIGALSATLYFLSTGSFDDFEGLLSVWPILFAGPMAGVIAASLFWLFRRPDQIGAA